MATIEIECPICKNKKVVKYGKDAKGNQKCICQNEECKRRVFKLTYKNKGFKPGINDEIIKLTANACGIREISRILGITTNKVMSVLKKQKNI